MNLQRTILELLEFYDLDDLVEFNAYLETTDADDKEMYSLLYDYTSLDYKLTGMTPNMDNYIALLKYKQDDRNI